MILQSIGIIKQGNNGWSPTPKDILGGIQYNPCNSVMS